MPTTRLLATLALGCIFTCATLVALGQKKHTISGYVSDSVSTESLMAATVYNTTAGTGTSSNQFGFYSLTLPEGNTNLLYSFVGYGTQTRSFALTRDTVINIRLAPSIEIEAVVISAEASERIQRKTQMSTVNIPMIQVKALPAFLGEVDPLKILQLTPGVQSGGEGSSGLYVRGGGPDQNLILLDGVPVYNASHLFGFFSVFNADAINSMELYKGGFPARYAGRTSSVLDIRMKEGNMQEFHGEGSIGLLAAKLTIEGPIWKDRTSFIVSGRRTYLDLLARPFIAMANNQNPNETTNLGYYFYDLTAKINHKFSDKDRIFLSTYLGSDVFYVNQKYRSDQITGSALDGATQEAHNQGLLRNAGYEGMASTAYHNESKNNAGLDWGNLTTALRWNHIFTNKLFGNTTVTYSRFNFNIGADGWERREGEESSFWMKYQSGIEDWAGKIDFDYLPSPNHHIRFGGNAIYHKFKPGAMGMKASSEGAEISLTDTTIGANRIEGIEFGGYVEDDMELGDRWKVNVGLHWAGFAVRSQLYHSLQPRVAARYLLTDDLSVKGSYARMEQYIHLLTNSGINLPTDLWVPSTDVLKPQRSDQIALGAAYNWQGRYELSLEGYYKDMQNVMEYNEGESFFDTEQGWESKVVQGKGKSYGLELFLQKKTGPFTGWIGYTLSWSKRLFDELNQGNWFYYKYDRRHDLSIVGIYKPTKTIELSGTWVYGTGNAITLPLARYPSQNPFKLGIGSDKETYVYSNRNAYRMDAYHRLDLSVSFIKKKRWGERRWIIGVYNAYSRKNPFFIDIEEKELGYDPETGNRKTTTKFVQYSIFPIIPSISYQFKF